MKRRQFTHCTVGASLAALSGCQQRKMIPVRDYATLAEQSQMVARGEISSTALVAQSLQRIAQHDHAGLGIRAVIEINPEAHAVAAQIDKEGSRGPMHGLPVLVKDNIDTADAMHTSAGSLAMLDTKPHRDAFIIQRLRQAGMLLLGKTNLSEWANIRSPNSTSGWSARGGLTRNPHRLTHNASGSSSGSAAAVAAGYVAAAIGTETNGSIISPASACGIVGLKPTVGLVSRSGIIPITHWQDTAGPMTRTVRDAAMLMNVLAGSDASDAQTVEADARQAIDYTLALQPDALKGRRLGLALTQSGTHPEVLRLLDQAVLALKDAGAIIVDPVELPNASKLGRLSFLAMLVELRQDLNVYLQQRGGKMQSLADVIAFNEAHRETEMPCFGQEFFEQADKLGSPGAVADGQAARELAHQLAGPEGIDAALAAHQLDALICATNDPTQAMDLATGDTHVRVASTPAAVAGYPHLTVPMGFIDSLPVGLSFMGAAWSEALLLALGHAFEQVLPAWRAPAI
jgi:amidase